jgi:hypothetical protein
LVKVDQKRLETEVFPLLRSLAKPDDTSYSKARKLIAQFVIESHQSPLSVIDKFLYGLACTASGEHLPGYATLDSSHVKSIHNLIATIKVYAEDTSQKRPLVFLMLASPGAGKSHFIRCIAGRLASLNVGAITYNMAGLQAGEDIIPPLDAARNLKVEDQIPLLFLDEFDSAPSNVPMLLPLLWDGEVTIGQRDLKLGKVIIVLAGSDPSLPLTMEEARSMRVEAQAPTSQTPKLVDLLSRINGGVFSIPPFFNAGQGIDRRADKVCVISHLLRQRFGRSLRDAPLSLLRFVARTEFRYGVRSIAHLVSMIPYRADVKSLKSEDLGLPLSSAVDLKNSSLAYHVLHQDQAYGVEKIWRDARENDCQMPVSMDKTGLFWSQEGYPEFYYAYALAEALRGMQDLGANRNNPVSQNNVAKRSRRASMRKGRASRARAK